MISIMHSTSGFFFNDFREQLRAQSCLPVQWSCLLQRVKTSRLWRGIPLVSSVHLIIIHPTVIKHRNSAGLYVPQM